MTRRDLLTSAAGAAAAISIPMGCGQSTVPAEVRIPAEEERHECTWMALAHSSAIWGADLISGVRTDLIRVANRIAEFEPVRMLVLKGDLGFAKARLSKAVEPVVADFDDLWIRDYGPQFVLDNRNRLRAFDLRFNGWGRKQAHARDAKVAAFMTKMLGIPVATSSVTMEGGAIEVDGKGMMIATKSCISNANRNPGLAHAEVDAALKAQFGLKQIVWLAGVSGKDITDGHTDFYARLLPDGRVLANLENDPESFDYEVTRSHLKALRTKFGGNNVLTVSPPGTVSPDHAHDDFAAGYVNYLVVNGAVIAPKFGDKSADNAARAALVLAYPGREVVMVTIDNIASGGGGIHCSTLHQPATR